MNEEWIRRASQQISAEFCNEFAGRLDEALRRNMMGASTDNLPSWGPIMRDGSPADPEKFGIAAIDCAIPEDQSQKTAADMEKMLATKARNAAIVGGSNLGQDKPMLYEDQIPKVATNAEIFAAIRARNAAVVRMESKTYPDGTAAFGPAPLPDVSPALWAKPLAKEVQGVTVSLTELGLENEIQAKADNGPRVTPSDIEMNIASEHYFTAAQGAAHHAAHNPRNFGDIGIPSLGLLTFCVLVLRNGFTVTGESACASPENFNAEIGRRIARENAAEKIWPLLGFRLRDELARPVLTEADAAADLAGVPRPARPA